METLTCSVDSDFLLARVFRWAREGTTDTSVAFTIVSNRAAAENLTTATRPGFHSVLSIAPGALSYAEDPAGEFAGNLPLTSTLSGRAVERLSSRSQPAPDAPPPVLATPPASPDDVGEPGVAAAAATAGLPFGTGPAQEADWLSLTITQHVAAAGLRFAVTLEKGVGSSDEGFGQVDLHDLRVEAGVLIGTASLLVASSSDSDDVSVIREQEPAEFAISFRRLDVPLATPSPEAEPVIIQGA
jgi:hypothetical protein